MYGFIAGSGLGVVRGSSTVAARQGRTRVRCCSSVVDIADSVRSGVFSAEEVTRKYLDRIEKVDGKVNAFLSVDVEAALAAAKRVDASRAKGDTLGPMAGVPVAVKDNLCTKGITTSAGSRILENYVPPYSATAVDRLEAAGAVVIGKTNMDEFGMGSSTEGSSFHVTRNPWAEDRVPGGSSGGSAAAMAAGECAIALGSDTGGSIRQPASFCGVTGLKCSYGRVSRYGLLAYASSLDTVGPITTSVRDAALVLEIIAGADRNDSTCLSAEVPNYLAALEQSVPGDLGGVRIGVVQEAFGDGVDPEVAARVEEAIEVLRKANAEVKRVSLPSLREACAAYYILAPSEASANLARYDGIRYGLRHDSSANVTELYNKSRVEGLGDEVKRRIMVGTFALSTGYYDAFYLRAQKVRTVVASSFQNAFAQGVDVLVSPVAPSPAFRIGEKTKDPISMYAGDVLTIPASLAGLPAISVPCGFASSGLPIGLQITGPFLDESSVLRVGHAFQVHTDFHNKSPVL